MSRQLHDRVSPSRACVYRGWKWRQWTTLAFILSRLLTATNCPPWSSFQSILEKREEEVEENKGSRDFHHFPRGTFTSLFLPFRCPRFLLRPPLRSFLLSVRAKGKRRLVSFRSWNSPPEANSGSVGIFFSSFFTKKRGGRGPWIVDRGSETTVLNWVQRTSAYSTRSRRATSPLVEKRPTSTRGIETSSPYHSPLLRLIPTYTRPREPAFIDDLATNAIILMRSCLRDNR